MLFYCEKWSKFVVLFYYEKYTKFNCTAMREGVTFDNKKCTSYISRTCVELFNCESKDLNFKAESRVAIDNQKYTGWR